jgi:cysteine-rich secretory family protein
VLVLAVGLLAGLFAVPGAAAAADLTISEAELAMVDALNVDRTALGLVPVQVDSRLMAIAHARSVDMATKHYFSHTQPDGRTVFDIISAQGITWYGAGEIIALNYDSTLAQSVQHANSQWLGSPGHKAIIVSTNYNYLGVGLALEGTKKIWTAVYLDGPDRTGAKAEAKTPTVAPGSSAVTKRVTVAWTGADVPLQVRTSGLHSFQVQKRVDGGAWATVLASTTGTTLTLDLACGHTYRFRVAARDVAGNWGAWSTTKTTLPPSTGAVIVRR